MSSRPETNWPLALVLMVVLAIASCSAPQSTVTPAYTPPTHHTREVPRTVMVSVGIGDCMTGPCVGNRCDDRILIYSANGKLHPQRLYGSYRWPPWLWDVCSVYNVDASEGEGVNEIENLGRDIDLRDVAVVWRGAER